MVELFVIVVPALIVGAICRKRDISAPLPLVAIGALIGLLPVVERVDPDPDVLLAAVLPPLLFGAALSASAVGIRRHLGAIGALSVGLVLVTAAAIAAAVHLVTPALPLAAALTLGAILAPADAVATAAVARKVGMKRGTQDLLDGENLLNDGAALTVFNVAVAIMVAGTVSTGRVAGIILVSVVGGIAIGIAGGIGLRLAVERLDDATIEGGLVLVMPYCIFFICEWVGASGFLAVVLAGLILSRNARRGSSSMRLVVLSLWSVLTFLMESIAFVLVGFELSFLLVEDGLDLLGESGWMILWVFLTVMVVRVVWVMGLISVPRIRRRAGHEGPVSYRDASVVAWASMRGPVSVFAALAIPLTLDDGSAWPMRDELILVTTCVVIATLLIQGTTLGPLMRRLGVAGFVDTGAAKAEADALAAGHAAAYAELEGLLREHPELHPEVVARLEHRTSNALPLHQLDGLGRAEQAAYRDAVITMLDAERAEYYRRRADGQLSEEAAQRLIRRLDLEQGALDLE